MQPTGGAAARWCCLLHCCEPTLNLNLGAHSDCSFFQPFVVSEIIKACWDWREHQQVVAWHAWRRQAIPRFQMHGSLFDLACLPQPLK